MTVLIVLIFISLLLLTILSCPIRIRFESNLVCYINWLFVKVRIRSVKGTLKTELKLFNKKTGFFKKKKLTEKKESTSPKKSKKKRPKITKNLIMETLADVAVKKLFRIILRFCWRCIKAIHVSVLKWNIGLKDYYWQGIITGLLHSIPRSKNLQVSGNFLEDNDFILVVKVSILRIITALLLLLIRFPYIRTYLLYRRVYLQKA